MREKGLQGIHHIFANVIRVFEGIQDCQMGWYTFRRRRIVAVAEVLYEWFRLGDEENESSAVLRIHTRMTLLFVR